MDNQVIQLQTSGENDLSYLIYQLKSGDRPVSFLQQKANYDMISTSKYFEFDHCKR